MSGLTGANRGDLETLEGLAIFDLEQWLHKAFQHSERYPEQHCKTDGSGSCSQNIFIQCPSNPLSGAARLIPNNGPGLIFVPKGLLNNWIRAWEQYYGSAASLNMRLLVAHAGYDNLYPLAPQIPELRCNYLKPLLEASIYHKRPESAYDQNFVAKSGQEGFIILTTKESYESRVESRIGFHRNYYLSEYDQRIRRNPKPYMDPAFMPGWILVDEFHKTKSVKAPPYNQTCDLQKRAADGVPFAVFMSGTPLETGPLNFLGPVTCLIDEKSENILYNGISPCTLIEKDKAFRSIQNRANKTSAHEIDRMKLQEIADWLVNLLPRFLIRRTSSTKWFGSKLLVWPPLIQAVVEVKFPGSLRKSLNDLQDRFQAAITERVETADHNTFAMFIKTITRQILLAATVPPLTTFWLNKQNKGIDDQRFLAATFCEKYLDEEGYMMQS